MFDGLWGVDCLGYTITPGGHNLTELSPEDPGWTHWLAVSGAYLCGFQLIICSYIYKYIYIRRPKHCILLFMHQLGFNPVKGGPILLLEYLGSKFSSYAFVQCIFAILELSSPWMEAWQAFFARKDTWSTVIYRQLFPLLFSKGQPHYFLANQISTCCIPGFFGSGKLEDQLRELSTRFRAWARVQGLEFLG